MPAGGPCQELFFIKLIWNIIWKTGITGVGTRDAGTIKVNYQIYMKYYTQNGITETGKTGVGTRDAGTSEFSNLKTETLETGITGGFPLFWCCLASNFHLIIYSN
jgi:hypothetical protein